MKSVAIVVAMGLMAGCSGGDEDSTEQEIADAKDGKIECDLSQHVGTYKASYTTISGDCGELPDQIEHLDEKTDEDSEDCKYTKGPQYTNNNCTREASFTCNGANGTLIHAVAIADGNADYSAQTGTVTFRYTEADGTGICVGTYEFKAVKQ